MIRGVASRLGYRLGVILMILELAHVPLPFPEHRLPLCEDRPGGACSTRSGPESRPSDGADRGIEWHWVASTPGAIDDDDEIEVVGAREDESDPADDAVRCPHMVAPHRARLHHFVRGHSSKGLGKIFAERSTFVGLVDVEAKGLHPATNDLAHMPRAAMLQRWIC